MTDETPNTAPSGTLDNLVMVPVARQVGVPLVVLDVILIAGIMAAFVWPPELNWWKIAIAVALVVIPGVITMRALAPARRMWKSAAAAPMWAREEAPMATVLRFKWAILVAAVLVAAGFLTKTMPTVGLLALGIQAAMAHHLFAAMAWQKEHDRRLLNETAVAASPHGARAYWAPKS